MGIGIYSAVLRVKPQAQNVPEGTPALALPGQFKPVTYDQIEAMSCNDDAWDELVKKVDMKWSLHRGPVGRYDMLGALGGDEFPNVKPMFPPPEIGHQVGQTLVDWLNEQRTAAEVKKRNEKGLWGPLKFELGESFEDEFLYDKGYTVSFFVLAELRKFDYNRPVEVMPPDPETELGTKLYDQRVADYAGKTYRDLFPPEWFEFLQWTRKENWDYLLFQTD